MSALPEDVNLIILNKLAFQDPISFFLATLACKSFHRAVERDPSLWVRAFLGEAVILDADAEELRQLTSVVEDFGGYKKLLGLKARRWKKGFSSSELSVVPVKLERLATVCILQHSRLLILAKNPNAHMSLVWADVRSAVDDGSTNHAQIVRNRSGQVLGSTEEIEMWALQKGSHASALWFQGHYTHSFRHRTHQYKAFPDVKVPGRVLLRAEFWVEYESILTLYLRSVLMLRAWFVETSDFCGVENCSSEPGVCLIIGAM